MAQDVELVKVAKALGDPTRLRLLRLLASREEVSCQALTAHAALAQATVSHHLKVLVDAGLASARREGSFHWYRAHREALLAHAAAIAGFAPVRPERRAAKPPIVEGRKPASRPRPAPARSPE